MPSRIAPVPVERAVEPALRSRLADLVNAAYLIGEAGMWRPGTTRVSPSEIGDLVEAGQLLALDTDGEIVGCVRVRPLHEQLWGFGMLAVDPNRQGSGAGGALVDAAEHRARAGGAQRMQLELLVPDHGEQASKARLKRWYSARGYALVEAGGLERDHPDLVPLLAVPCTYEIWHKTLPPRAPYSAAANS